MSIYKKLHSAKSEIGAISKDSRNPFFKSKYFDINQLLEHTEPILQKHDLLCLQPILEGVVTSQIIDVETGEKVESGIALTNITDPQKRGSEITYYRRYTLASLLGMQAEDDDANKASRKKPAAKPVISEDQLAKATAFIESGGKISDIEIKYLLTEAQKTHLNSIA